MRARTHTFVCCCVCISVVVKSLHRVSFETLWTIAHQASLSMGFPRQEYRSGLPFPTAGDLPNPGIEPESPAFPALAGGFFTSAPPGKPFVYTLTHQFKDRERLRDSSW